jgi:methylase of polypeptide subunit release factors
VHRGLLDETGTAQLRRALTGYTVDGVYDLLGPVGRSALERADHHGVARQLRPHGGDRLPTLVRLFLLGADVPAADAERALAPLPLDAARAAGLIEVSGADARALLDVRPHGSGDADWWVVSDFGSDVRPGPLPTDHVLGVGSASTTLAQAVPRRPVGRALDVGTGSGIQALYLSGHADAVVATDVSDRALRLAATTAALSGLSWDLRVGSLLDPVAGETFDLIVANPPFVVSAGGEWTYRDSGLAGDALSEHLVRAIPRALAPGGSAHLLANWIVPADGDWAGRVGGWLAGAGCDGWVWQREVADPAEYAALWLRDAGLDPAGPEWGPRYDAWLDWFAAQGVAAVGMGMVSLWAGGGDDPVIVCEDVPQALGQPVGPELPAWIARQRWLAATTDRALLAAALTAAPDVRRERSDRPDPGGGWEPVAATLRRLDGMRWEVEVDDAVAALVAGCDGTTALLAPVTVLAAAVGRPVDEVAAAVLPVVRDLVGRGFLLTPGTAS